ncbi:unnamed protein product [Brugia timori]|uniref:Uncharacterized protein n=1 Tax=Brugia timori TaxID=42155 RepID=A0A0R3QL22_9BILA|nr:unnamed protein product [Brugia timori]
MHHNWKLIVSLVLLILNWVNAKRKIDYLYGKPRDC